VVGREILFVLLLQVAHMRFFLAKPCHHANDGATELRSSNKMRATQGQLRRLLPALLALSAVIFFPITADATLYVIVLDKGEIAIASDGKWLTVSGDKSAPVSHLEEKVVRVGPQLAFMCGGLTEIDTATVKIHAADLVKELYSVHGTKQVFDHTMTVLAGAFGRNMSERLNQLSPEQKNRILFLRQQVSTSGRELLECIFAGRDADNKLKVETVDVYPDWPAAQNQSFTYHVDESIGSDSPHLILSGEVTTLKAGFEDTQSPLGSLPSFQKWERAFQSHSMNPEATAEALVDLAIKYSPHGSTALIGYPIYVYRLDAAGSLRRVRVVSRGHAVPLPD
jgi:hypothetical protein